MSSSASAAGLNRTRTLRQPTAGLGKLQKKDEDRKAPDAVVTTTLTSSVTADPRTMSPSRLPKPGSVSSAATRSRIGTVGSGIQQQPPTRTKTLGNTGLSRSGSLATRKTSAQSTAAEDGPGTDTARPRPRPLSTATRLTRPVSMISTSKISPVSSSSPSSAQPASATLNTPPAKPEPPRSTTHTRTKSTATSLNSVTTLRPPRAPSTASAGSTPLSTTPTAVNTKRPTGRANTSTAQSGPSQRHTSTNTSLTSGGGPAKPITKSTTADDPPPPPRLRPAFNTLQQHYSPARNLAPKPLTSTYLAPPTPSKLPANIALSSETAKRQTELLQLHLLHRDADATAASWHESARARLGQRFQAVAEDQAVAAREEARAEEGKNVAALVAWSGGGGEEQLEERIQMLDGVVSGVWSVGEPGGRYARVVRGFENWAMQMQKAVAARRGALVDGSGEVAFIGELDAGWRDEVSWLVRKLDEWRRQLAHLELGLPEEEVETAEPGQDASSLSRIVMGCRAQVHNMLAELDVMEQIEREAIGQEAAWIRRVNREDETDDTPRAGAIWRAF